jgi:hypothetical protein
LNAKKAVENIRSTVDQNANNSGTKQKDNDKSLTDLNKSINTNNVNKSTSETNQHYQAQGDISKINSTEQVKVKTPNTLGNEYPEGVSQETFTRTDENGFMTTILTRRIVVINGHADVYVRTQTLSVITYSKNGVPVNETVWQKETQGPHLQKNY